MTWLLVGAQDSDSVNIRTRDNVVHGTKTVEETLAMLRKYQAEYTKDV